MTKVKQSELINELEQLVKYGETSKISDCLEKIESKSSLSSTEKIILSKAYYAEGDYYNSIKVLGKEKDQFELLDCDLNELLLYTRFIFLVSSFGLGSTAKKLIQKLEYALSERNISVNDLPAGVNAYLGYCYMNIEEYSDAVFTYKNFFNDQTHTNSKRILNTIFFAECLYLNDEKDKAISLLIDNLKACEGEEDYLNGIMYQSIGQLYNEEHDYEKGLAFLKKSKSFFDTCDDSKDKSYMFRDMAISLYFLKEEKEALKLMELSYSIIREDLSLESTKIKALYWLEVMESSELNNYDLISIRNHFKSPFRSTFKNVKDCWVLTQDELTESTYKDTIDRDSYALKIDLVSGIVSTLKNPLSLIQTKCLAYIISSGNIGISIWALYDLIYEGEALNLDLGKSRVETLISSLKKLGFKFIRNKECYRLEFSVAAEYIIPKNIESIGIFNIIVASFNFFTSKNMQDLLCVSQSTASRIIKDLILKKIIVEQRQGRKIVYEVISENYIINKAS